MASVLPLELAAEYYDASTLAALSQTTKECAASKMLAAQWGGVFERRFPCLAWIPAFDGSLADPRGVVRSLLAAAPPLLALNYPLPPARVMRKDECYRCAKTSSSRPSYQDAARLRCRTGRCSKVPYVSGTRRT